MLIGNDGDDTLAGLRGNDTLDGGPGSDTLDYSAADSGVSVNLATAAAQSTVGGATDTVLGAENVVGSAFADTLTGTTAANRLTGGDGDDSLVGAAGDDDLDGGSGTDTADYSASALGVTVDLWSAGRRTPAVRAPTRSRSSRTSPAGLRAIVSRAERERTS